MASTTTKPVKLGELLREQQEPFVLEAYLFERGCLRKSNSISSSKSLKRSCSWGQNKSKKGTPSFSKLLRSVYNKLVSKNGGSRTENSEKEEGKFDADTEITLPRDCLEDSDGLSSSSSSRTQYESCCDSEKDEAVATVSFQNEDQVSLAVEGTSRISNLCNMKVERKIAMLNGETSSKKKQSKEHTSISVLEDRPYHAVPNKVIEESTLSSSLWELLFQPPLEKPKGTSGVPEILEPVRSNPSPHKSKRMLQQTRQLLFDCVREMTETHAKQMKEQNSTKFLGAEELGKLIYQKQRIWDRQAGNETNIDFLLDSDFEEWNCNEQEEICWKIGDAILEDIIEEICCSPIEFRSS
ncbi:hypothetical protein ACLB2K_009945 [Fragaria x ananassa]